MPAESIKIDFDELIDRLQKAKKSDFKNDVFEQARNLIASHHAKFAREGWQIAGLPDDQITAQFLAIADWPRLSNLLYDLMSERKQSSHSWGWYVTVALQRMHGISPERVREIRQKIRHLSPDSQINNEAPTLRCSPMNAGTYRGGKPGGYEPAGLTTENLQRQLRAVASSKFMR